MVVSREPIYLTLVVGFKDDFRLMLMPFSWVVNKVFNKVFK